jgi:hypothetical protein
MKCHPSEYFCYSLLPDDDLFQSKHVVTELCVCDKTSLVVIDGPVLLLSVITVG